MAPPKKTQAAPDVEAEVEDEELPIVETLGIVHKKNVGYVVVALRSQGMRILEVEQCSEPETQMAWAHERLKIEIARRILTLRSLGKGPRS